MKLLLKKEDFETSRYIDSGDCAVARALNRRFPNKWVSVSPMYATVRNPGPIRFEIQNWEVVADAYYKKKPTEDMSVVLGPVDLKSWFKSLFL